MKEIYYIKISGKVNVPAKVDIGHNYKLVADCSVVSEQKSDLENGEFSITSKMIPITAEITKDNGETIKAADTRRVSQKIRNMLWKEWDREGCIYPFEEVYEQVGYLVMRDLPQYLREAIKKFENQ